MIKIPKVESHAFKGFYLDLDGVFADLERMIEQISGKPKEELSKKEFWRVVYSVPDFFYRLELMEDSHHLWEYTRQYQPKFLTGAPSGQRAQDHKRLWVKEKFGPEWETIVLPAREKQLYSGPDKVLIDDTVRNIDEWVAKGGHGILHTGDVWETIKKVEELRQAYSL